MPAADLSRSLEAKELPPIQRAGVTLTVLVSLVLLMLALPLGSAGFVTEAFAGAAVIFLYNWRNRLDWLAAAVVAAGLGGIYKATGAAVTPWIGWDFCFPAALYGMATLTVLFYRATGADEAGRRRLMVLIGHVALLPALCLGCVVMVWLDLGLTPRTYDRFLYAFDRSLGCDPSFLMGAVFRSHNLLRLAASLVYSNLPVNLCVLYAVWLWHRPAGAPDVRLVFAVLGISGFALYQFCPASGPIYLFGKAFPFQPPALASLAMETVDLRNVPRTAMPSGHLAWCLLVVFNSWWYRSWLLRSYAVICLVLTAAATLGLGEHYLIDLVVAVPLSVAIQLACSATAGRWLRVAICMSMVVAWLVILRTGIGWHAQPIASWSAVGITLLASAVLYREGSRRGSEEASLAGAALFARVTGAG